MFPPLISSICVVYIYIPPAMYSVYCELDREGFVMYLLSMHLGEYLSHPNEFFLFYFLSMCNIECKHFKFEALLQKHF